MGKRDAATRKMLESRVLVDCDTINSHKYYSGRSAVATPSTTYTCVHVQCHAIRPRQGFMRMNWGEGA